MGSVCIIPARGGSTRIPGKNIKIFHGKPIIAYSIEAAAESGLFDEIYVSSEYNEILGVAREFGAEYVIRPSDLARDEIGTQEVMRDAIQSLSIEPREVVCCLYPCAPLVDASDLLLAFNMLTMRPFSYVVSVGTKPLRDIGNFYLGQARKFGVEALWSVYTGVYLMPPERAIDINTESDFLRAEEMYAKLHR